MSTPSPQASSNADFTVSEVEGWQTYRNEEYGFEFQVPESLFNVFFSGSKGIDSLNEYKLLSKEYQHPSNLDQIIIDIERMAGDNLEKKQTSIKELRKAKVGERLFNLETTKEQIIKAKDIDIGGCIGTEAYDEISENQIKAIVFGCLTKENIHLRLVFITKELSKDNKKLFDQILSTFRFVDGGREEGNAAKTACEQSGDAYAACSANPSQNAGICVSCQCPEDSMWSFNKEMCITM
ncbi:MAG: hypothetical protein A3E07_02875 [Candidatus Wildermuthbacteria bacterium RIFCSPHIGHO2_12_FULL_45_9]|uniref:Uncharacterized protein n=1 Tax=Candidatus Wildermuthbacteria bacterium RIFCSPHIGHO2_02_FULL_45_25 TaxID=1802450 RepID=A0A1G2R6H4_9BACT|nr:MAG: hypothetical protein A2748_01240 [Candidatus Wildermuthbacteria bacterium RIFCSPHIGHO2_01_FULL_45_20]OHA67852.1 MAG: hypothetical protein A3C04_02865 [Candidatus Wildermuthbacteria bacterium RIFCSPHIGHO2_02_FULL_45_25]OHA71071.1 MAG: hypothetical protein A3E07_02875 [Candidatus Wildermuthbacteria bacterium RIFCSPHIGHO2_12_FULL_45_9]